MENIIEVIKGRRSIKKFKPDGAVAKVDENLL